MTYLWIGLAGVLGTTAMILFMALTHGFRLANADMVRAIGSIVTRSYEDSLVPGLLVHYTAGIIFAFCYALFIGMAPVTNPKVTLVLAVALGLLHGIIIGLLLITEITEFHPVQQFQKAGTEVALAHLLGHVVYGGTVGVVLVFTQVQMSGLWLDLREDSGLPLGEVLGFVPLWLMLFGAPLLFVVYTVGGFWWEKVKADKVAAKK